MKIDTIKKKEEKRTNQQNSALYKYFQLYADALNERGHTVPAVLEKAEIDIFWTKENFKVNIWHEIQRKMYGTVSTTKLLKLEQIDKIHDVITAFVAREFSDVGYIPFPSIEEIINNK